VESLSEILEGELEQAVEVKDKKSLHRYVTLLTENLALRHRNEKEHSEFREAFLKIENRMERIITEMKEGFRRMDERFSAVDKRFESLEKRMDERFTAVDKRFADVDRRFTMMFRFITVGFVVLATMMSVFQFLD